MNQETKQFINKSLESWYEASAYGDHVPPHLGELLESFTKKHGLLNAEGMNQMIMEADGLDPWTILFECIFEAAANHTVAQIANGVYDRDENVLKLIGATEIPPKATT